MQNYIFVKSYGGRIRGLRLSSTINTSDGRTSAHLIKNGTEFDGVSAATPFLPVLVQDDGAGAVYWRRLYPLTLKSGSRGIRRIGGVIGLQDDSDGDSTITIVINS